MNPSTLVEAKSLWRATSSLASKEKNVEIVACVPAPYLAAFAGKPSKSGIRLGAQDVSVFTDGAHTGDYSARMLANLDVRYVIVGHSERRLAGETSAHVFEKIKMALSEGITPIVCVGEAKRTEDGEYFREIENMLCETLGKLSSKLIEKIVIAYEPVWAIGKNAVRAATSAECREAVLFIKKILADKYGMRKKFCRIIYGASVDEKNTATFFRDGGIDGLLIGRASLQAVTMKSIVQYAKSR